MDHAEGTDRRARRFGSVGEKRRIVELTLEPGASVACVARANGVNANRVFAWRHALQLGELAEPAAASTALLPVILAAPGEAEMQEPTLQQSATFGSPPFQAVEMRLAVDVSPEGRERFSWAKASFSGSTYLSQIYELFDTASIPYGSYIHQNVSGTTLEPLLLLRSPSIPGRQALSVETEMSRANSRQ